MSRRIACLLLAFCAAPAFAASPLPGNLLLLSACPGDQRLADTGKEAAFAAVLTPILTGAINQAIKGYGAHLQAAAKPAVVDSIHTGSYYYAVSGDAVELNVRCIVFASRAKRDSGTSLQAVTSGYQSVSYQYDVASGSERLSAPIDGSAQLAEKLRMLGYSDRMPAFLAVIDVENNFKTRIGRFVPRYVFLDHSLREKGSRKPRDIKLGIAMTSPLADKPIAADAIEFSEISPGQFRRRDIDNPHTGSLRVTGNWFALPEPSKALSDRAADRKSFQETIGQETLAAELALASATALGRPDLPQACSGLDRAKADLATVTGQLAAENAKKEADRNAKMVAQLTQTGNYYQSCIKVDIALAKLVKVEFKKGESFLPVDLVVTETEYRHRPVAQFFGDLLSTDSVATGATTALVNEFDPATRHAADEKEAAADATALSSYEDALLDARKAELAYASATDDKRALALLDLEFKERKANRLADAAGVDRPYPAAGVRP